MKPMHKTGYSVYPVVLFLLILVCACGHRPPIDTSGQNSAIYRYSGKGEALLERYAPVFRVADHHQPYNRIGKPAAAYGRYGEEIISVDAAQPTVYAGQREFKTGRGKYLNLIYRIHFPEVPYSLIPFHLTAGKNVGLMVVITLNNHRKPVLITTVHTCGCYMAVIPTTHLPAAARPEGWPAPVLSVYGETLPAELNFQGRTDPRIVLHIRSAEHRVADIQVTSTDQLSRFRGKTIPVAMLSLRDLEKIPLNGGSTSFYHQNGILKGHVKGSIKPWEMLFMSVISLDFFVGSDKAYQDKAVSGNPFYTSLKPWNRNLSDMYFFDRFLEFWGWRL